MRRGPYALSDVNGPHRGLLCKLPYPNRPLSFSHVHAHLFPIFVLFPISEYDTNISVPSAVGPENNVLLFAPHDDEIIITHLRFLRQSFSSNEIATHTTPLMLPDSLQVEFPKVIRYQPRLFCLKQVSILLNKLPFCLSKHVGPLDQSSNR